MCCNMIHQLDCCHFEDATLCNLMTTLLIYKYMYIDPFVLKVCHPFLVKEVGHA